MSSARSVAETIDRLRTASHVALRSSKYLDFDLDADLFWVIDNDEVRGSLYRGCLVLCRPGQERLRPPADRLRAGLGSNGNFRSRIMVAIWRNLYRQLLGTTRIRLDSTDLISNS